MEKNSYSDLFSSIAQELPYNLEAEQSVLGAVLIDADCIPEALNHLKPEYFYRQLLSFFKSSRYVYKRAEAVTKEALDGLENLKAELEKDEPSLIISRRPCALLKSVKHSAPVVIDEEKCIGCKACLNVGCPALSQGKKADGKGIALIDNTQCVGCGVCAEACKFDAIKKGGVN